MLTRWREIGKNFGEHLQSDNFNTIVDSLDLPSAESKNLKQVGIIAQIHKVASLVVTYANLGSLGYRDLMDLFIKGK